MKSKNHIVWFVLLIYCTILAILTGFETQETDNSKQYEEIVVVSTETPQPTATPTPTVAPTPTPAPYIKMTLKASAYCCENYPHICNDGDATNTATGTTPTAGRTIAVDPSVIPYGSEVTINGHTYIAEDTGGHIKGNRVDILFATHQEANNFGRRTVTAYVKR